MVESYVFRRAICDIPTNSLNKTFANLSSELDKEHYLESIKAAFNKKETYRRFPTDNEFRTQFITKNVYNSKVRKYLFDKLENFERKETVNLENYTIEHIMPQNKNISEIWKNDLGETWQFVHDKYLHTIGNLTLTGYNPELSDRPFLEKRNMEGGFADSPIRLNSSLAHLEHWNEDEIVKRANILIDKTLQIWEFPSLPQEILDKYADVEDDVEEEFDDDSTGPTWEEEFDDDSTGPTWEEEFEKASNDVKQNITKLISSINEKFDCVVESSHKWLFFYLNKPSERKNLFALIVAGRNTSNVIFRINPKTFKDNDKTRKVAGWFFPRGTERRMTIKDEDISEIIHYLEHSYSTTKSLQRTLTF